jgi:hypothetical protein
MSVATVANWSFNLLVALTFLTMIDVLGRPGGFWLYAGVGVIAWLFIYRLVPETRGRSLEQIEEHWRQGKHPREMGVKDAPERDGGISPGDTQVGTTASCAGRPSSTRYARSFA